MTDDCNRVEKRSLLESSNVTPAPPSVNRPIPVPSVYLDERGEIHNLQVGGLRINLLSSKKGVMRSGDIHQNTQHDFVVKGKVEVWKLTANGTQKTIYHSYDYVRIEPFVPHIFHFLEDTIMAEWWEPQGFYAWFYEPYRKLVQHSFQRTCPGRFQLWKADSDDEGGCSSSTASIGIISLALAAGVTIGYVLGRHNSSSRY
ncbi:expressed unknown protein [Seminavis robusta]|uniref:Uncharacterized protein n=1 Tax=Seminavis robusta TaxID=568900 RepID=A0A9N8ENP6_9STRA|nr:expressed unknown protein [Seminavis robusta]|eukprot:Sro1442_g273100.1 n/a (201) ;mRNA; r:28123-28725